MKFILLSLLLGFTSAASAACDNSVVDSLTKKALIVMARRYKATKAGMGVAIQTGNVVTTSVVIFQGVGGNDGVLVDRIGSVAIDLEKCALKNTLIGTFDVLDVTAAE